MYIYSNHSKSPELIAHSLCILSTEYHPEKYSAFSKLLSEIYNETFNPTDVLSCYLDIFTGGRHEFPRVGVFDSNEFNNNDHLLAASIKDIVLLLEESTVWLWAALFMKKRVVLYAENFTAIQKHIRALPLFVSHRRDWSLLRPFVNLNNEDEIRELNQVSIYIAGFTDISVKQRNDLYDILIDLSSGTFSISDKSKDDFVDTSLHNQVRKVVQETLENNQKLDKDIIKDIRDSNKNIVDNLKKLLKEGFVSFETIQEQDYPPPLKAFYYSVASAEGMTKIG